MSQMLQIHDQLRELILSLDLTPLSYARFLSKQPLREANVI